MPGGGPECGGSVVVYLKGDGDGDRGPEFHRPGGHHQYGAASLIMQKVHDEGLAMDEVLDLDYGAFVESLGSDVVGSRTRNATLGLST